VPTANIHTAVSTVVDHAATTNRVPVLVSYDIPVRDCHGYSGGGAKSADDYRAWINAFADGIGSHRAVVILEPDALAQLDCLASQDQSTRLSLLKHAVHRLARRNTTVYVDAGHSGWIAPDTMATRLRAVDISSARGFSLNVSNFGKTTDEVTYGHLLSAALGVRTPFVIDTSRNGLGPTPDNAWCNPPGRALGATPTTQTAQIDVDAFLWIKRPGESDGTCNGGPPAGQFWTDYAISLAARSTIAH
jgi:endoglucanase